MVPNQWHILHRTHSSIHTSQEEGGVFHLQYVGSENEVSSHLFPSSYYATVSSHDMLPLFERVVFLISNVSLSSSWCVGVTAREGPSTDHHAFYDSTFYGVHSNGRSLWRFDGGSPDLVLDTFSNHSSMVKMRIRWHADRGDLPLIIELITDHQPPLCLGWRIPRCVARPFFFLVSLTPNSGMTISPPSIGEEKEEESY